MSTQVYIQREDAEAEPFIASLNSFLNRGESSLSPYLMRQKMLNLFLPLGHLISKELLHHLHRLRAVDQKGVSQLRRNLFALQQSLSSTITFGADTARSSAPVTFDRPRRFCDLLSFDQEGILQFASVFAASLNKATASTIEAMGDQEKVSLLDAEGGRLGGLKVIDFFEAMRLVSKNAKEGESGEEQLMELFGLSRWPLHLNG